MRFARNRALCANLGATLKFGVRTQAFHVLAAEAARALKGRYTIEGGSVRLAPPEYVIVRKLEYFREGGSEKHLRDIRSMLAVSGEHIDREELERWIERRGLAAEWAKLELQRRSP